MFILIARIINYWIFLNATRKNKFYWRLLPTVKKVIYYYTIDDSYLYSRLFIFRLKINLFDKTIGNSIHIYEIIIK